jgi:hypothetical protein
MNVPFKYDLPNSASVNNSIFILHRKIKKLIKALPHTSFLETDNNRNVFTKHGLHQNKLGNRLVTYQIVSFLQFYYEHKYSVPIILHWHNESHDNNILMYEGNKVKVPIRSSESYYKDSSNLDI